ncbi:hypothetical protein Ahy_B06g080692 isoform A [Arachis hypogaea]|uniref:Cathepsin propeptide inhibitor domain-containing protein n=1 Tax=Arachis hypogaea TaxID=3818 RepID=A0A444YIV7_ARAHY|nr:hypothetical protein Ahy_B06g080692 isoform A [Arachis hypogaea]
MANPASSPAVTLEPKPSTLNHNPIPSLDPFSSFPNGSLLLRIFAGPLFAPPVAPSFCPLPPQASHFSSLPNPSGDAAPPILAYHNPSIPPPSVSSAAVMAPGVAFAVGGVAVSLFVPHMQPMMSYLVPPGQPTIPTLRPPYAMPNGYAAIPGAPQTAVPPIGGFCCFHSSTFIHEHNSTGNKPYKLVLNKFADFTNEEYRARYLGTKPRSSSQQQQLLFGNKKSDRYAFGAGNELLASVDWREKGVVSPVKDQGQCDLFVLDRIMDLDGFDLLYRFLVRRTGNNFNANYMIPVPIDGIKNHYVLDQGINRERIEQMEACLKQDILLEAARYGNKILVTDELPDG